MKNGYKPIIEQWIEIWNSGEKVFTLHYLQKIKKVKNTEKDIIETIKYSAKISIDPTIKKGNNKGKSFKIYAAGLHAIYKAMEEVYFYKGVFLFFAKGNFIFD